MLKRSRSLENDYDVVEYPAKTPKLGKTEETSEKVNATHIIGNKHVHYSHKEKKTLTGNIDYITKAMEKISKSSAIKEKSIVKLTLSFSALHNEDADHFNDLFGHMWTFIKNKIPQKCHLKIHFDYEAGPKDLLASGNILERFIEYSVNKKHQFEVSSFEFPYGCHLQSLEEKNLTKVKAFLDGLEKLFEKCQYLHINNLMEDLDDQHDAFKSDNCTKTRYGIKWKEGISNLLKSFEKSVASRLVVKNKKTAPSPSLFSPRQQNEHTQTIGTSKNCSNNTPRAPI